MQKPNIKVRAASLPQFRFLHHVYWNGAKKGNATRRARKAEPNEKKSTKNGMVILFVSTHPDRFVARGSPASWARCPVGFGFLVEEQTKNIDDIRFRLCQDANYQAIPWLALKRWEKRRNWRTHIYTYTVAHCTKKHRRVYKNCINLLHTRCTTTLGHMKREVEGIGDWELIFFQICSSVS